MSKLKIAIQKSGRLSETSLELLKECGIKFSNGDRKYTRLTSCFNENTVKGFLYDLEQTISQRIDDDEENSYPNTLFRKGVNKVAQKVGEEAVELLIEAKDNNVDLFKNEAADLLYHLLILLKAKDIKLQEIELVLKKRVR